jgi:hypothetical protein
MNSITPEVFLNTLFPPELLRDDEQVVVAWPDWFISKETGQRVDYYVQRGSRRIPESESTYFCVSTVERQRRRQVKKRLQEVRTAFVLVVDDVGTKSIGPPVPPSWELQTSAGNYQWGWLIEPYDVSSPAGQAYYDSCLWSLAKAGMNDPGFRSATRLARLPASMHKSGFRAVVTSWRPDAVWDLPDLMLAFGVPMVKPRKVRALAPGAYTSLSQVSDPVYRWLVDNWTVFGHNDQWVHIECPWRSSHTDGAQGSTSTAYSPDGYGLEGRGFKCLHGHCAKRDMRGFIKFVASQPGADQRIAGLLFGDF